ncbi:MAG: gluconokinase [Chthoniobacterales bacterium]
MVAIIFGVSGTGKTTLGKRLARDLGWSFYEGDDFHSRANIDKMKRGIPLNDQDRQPWLAGLREVIERCLAHKENAVLACSALKRKYRRSLRVNADVKFVFLRGDYELVRKQLARRRGHFMRPELLKSQFDALEEPGPKEHAIVIQLGRGPRELVREIKDRLED